MPTHSSLTEAELHEPKGADTAAINTVYVSNGAGSGSWTNALGTATSISTLELTASSAVDQNPTGTDAPMKIGFGAAQNGPSDHVQLAADGRVTINEGGQYRFSLALSIGRDTATGISDLLFYVSVNGTPQPPASLIRISSADAIERYNHIFVAQAGTGDFYDFYLVRDSGGDNSGGLVAFSPTDASIPDVTSASITVRETKIT